ncbi:hypothetical protein JCM19237_4309 [Photobacterium aphoticum]|uniref:Uncharacterized protein n=1 Tax=Photobacterium aphoticum TaxID=754436 RepID=A0A090QRR4_9GAMM|nr:hypothetical protein JCM19237_4309 [Photobacterium aphoticum]
MGEPVTNFACSGALADWEEDEGTQFPFVPCKKDNDYGGKCEK